MRIKYLLRSEATPGTVTNGDSHDHSGGDGAQIDHGGLGGLSDDDHTQYVKHALATAANDFVAASGSGAFVKKTLAETKTILGVLNHNWAASTDPGVGDDSADGYAVGSVWFNLTGGRLWQAKSVSVGAAVWVEVLARTAGVTIISPRDATVDTYLHIGARYSETPSSNRAWAIKANKYQAGDNNYALDFIWGIDGGGGGNSSMFRIFNNATPLFQVVTASGLLLFGNSSALTSVTSLTDRIVYASDPIKFNTLEIADTSADIKYPLLISHRKTDSLVVATGAGMKFVVIEGTAAAQAPVILGGISAVRETSGNDGSLRLYDSVSGTLTEVMRLYGGNVGIGVTSAPLAKFTIAAGAADTNTEILRVNRTNDALRYNSIFSYVSGGGGGASYSFYLHNDVTTSSQTLAMQLNLLGIISYVGSISSYYPGSTTKRIQISRVSGYGFISAQTDGGSYDHLALNPFGGNVGIGVDPSYPIHYVNSDSTATTDFLLNPTVKSSGNFIDFQINTASKAKIDYTGQATFNGIVIGGTSRLSMRPFIEIGKIAVNSKPTIVQRGAASGYSLPIYNSDYEELFISEYIAGRWNGASDITLSIIGYLDTAEDVNDDFALQLSWANKSTGSGTWSDATNDLTVVTNIDTGRNAQYSIYKVDFTIDWDLPAVDIAASDFFAGRIRRVAVGGGNTEMSGEFVITSIVISYTVNKVFKAS